MACELSQLHDDFGSAIMMECNAMSLVQYNYIINTNCIIGRLHFHLNRCYSHHRVSMMPLTVIIITIIIGHVSNGQRQTDKGINKSIEIGRDGVKRWRRNIYLNRSKESDWYFRHDYNLYYDCKESTMCWNLLSELEARWPLLLFMLLFTENRCKTGLMVDVLEQRGKQRFQGRCLWQFVALVKVNDFLWHFFNWVDLQLDSMKRKLYPSSAPHHYFIAFTALLSNCYCYNNLPYYSH